MQFIIEDLIISINKSLAEAGEQSITMRQLEIVSRHTASFNQAGRVTDRSLNATQNAHSTPRMQRGGHNGR